MEPSDNKQRTLQDALSDESSSALQRYLDLALGQKSLLTLLKYELIMTFVSPLPGALGFLLRKHLYPKILKNVGRNVIFGRNITIRHGYKISIGNHSVIDDNAVLDAKGEDNQGITIGAQTIISRNCILSCKNGDIKIGDNVAFGPNGLIHAVNESHVCIGNDTAIAAYVYLIGGGNYYTERTDIPIKKQGYYSKGGVTLGNGVWMGSHVQVLDGVEIGEGAIIGAGALVNKSIESLSIAAGVPAKMLKRRTPVPAAAQDTRPNSTRATCTHPEASDSRARS